MPFKVVPLGSNTLPTFAKDFGSISGNHFSIPVCYWKFCCYFFGAHESLPFHNTFGGGNRITLSENQHFHQP
jgi:hypothetical protein